MLKETTRSVRQYFAIVGILLILINALNWDNAKTSSLLLASFVVDVGLGLAFISIAAAFHHLLRNAPGLIKAMLAAKLGSAIFGWIAVVTITHEYRGLMPVAVQIMVCVYLWRSITRLAGTSAGI